MILHGLLSCIGCQTSILMEMMLMSDCFDFVKFRQLLEATDNLTERLRWQVYHSCAPVS